MRHSAKPRTKRLLRLSLAAAMLVTLVAGVYLVWPTHRGYQVIGWFSDAVGIYPGDEVQIVGVPVGTIDSIQPQATGVKITMTVDEHVRIPADAKAIIVAPNLVSARFIQLAPAYKQGVSLSDGAVIGPDRTAVPIEWDEVKKQLAELSSQLGPRPGGTQGPLGSLINQAADTFDGKGGSFRRALRELSQTAGRLGDSRTDLFGTIKNLQILVNALADSTEQIVQFADHVATVSQVLADSTVRLNSTLTALDRALQDVKGFLNKNNDTLIDSVNNLTDFTQILTNRSRDLEQLLHVAPNGIVNFYNMYSPAQGTVGGLVSIPNFANPVQFICGGVLEATGTTDNFKRAEICRERMGPVLRRLTVNYPPFLFHPINSITAYKGQVIYDKPETQAKAQTPVGQLQWQPLPGVRAPQGPPNIDLGLLLLPPGPGTSPAAGPGR